MTLDELARRFEDVKKTKETSYQCRCPAHEDKQASLTLSQGRNGHLLLHCHAGCDYRDILEKVGLTVGDITPDGPRTKPSWEDNLLRYKRKSGKDPAIEIESTYRYYNVFSGSYEFTKVRFKQPKSFSYVIEDSTTPWGYRAKVENRKELPTLYGNIGKVKEAIANGEVVYYVEGEKDVQTMERFGFPTVTCGGAGDFKEPIIPFFKDADLVVIQDNDGAGTKLANTIERLLRGTAKRVRSVTPYKDIEKGDVSDFFEAGHSREELLDLITNWDKLEKAPKFETVEQKDVYSMLDFNSKGSPLASSENFATILKNDRMLNGLRYNEMTSDWDLVDEIGRSKPFDAEQDAKARRYIEKTYGIWQEQKFNTAMLSLRTELSYNPLKEVIESTTWDGVPRIEYFLRDWAGCEDESYTRECSRLVFAGAINRLYNPGCKFDNMIVLVGKQGGGKTTLVKWLAIQDQYFRTIEKLSDNFGKEAKEKLQGCFIGEVGEMSATQKGSLESVKSFITECSDFYRESYGKKPEHHLRHNIFIGTTNEEQFLTDVTGNRRFYPVKVTMERGCLIGREAECRDYILQCYAEAKYLLDHHDPKISPIEDHSLLDVFETRQQEATQEDPLVGMIEDYLDRFANNYVCTQMIWNEVARKIYNRDSRRSDLISIGHILDSIPGWKRKNGKHNFVTKNGDVSNYGRQRYWERVNHLPEGTCLPNDSET